MNVLNVHTEVFHCPHTTGGEIQGESGESQPAESTDDAEVRTDFWSVQGDFIYRQHTEPRAQLCVPKEETFTIPLKYIDVTRSIDLDVMKEKNIDDYWNVDSSKHLQDSSRESGEELTKIQATARPDHAWPEIWTRIGKAAQKSRKQEWATEKSKLDNARKPKGIYLLC